MLVFFVSFSLGSDSLSSVTTLLKQSKWEAAYGMATTIITKDGILDADPKLFFLRGQAANKIGKHEDSIKDMSRFLMSGKAADRDKSVAYATRGWSRLRLGNIEEVAQDAAESGDSALKRAVNDARALWDAAKASTSASVAFQKYEQLLKLTTSAAEIFGKAAQKALLLGNSSVFDDLSQKAMRLAPKNAEILEMRGRFFIGETMFALAQKHLKLCTSVASNAAVCMSLLKANGAFQTQEKLAKEALSKKDFEKAEGHIAECSKVVGLVGIEGSKLSLAVQGLEVKVLIARGKKEKAIKTLNDLVKASPANDEAVLQRGEILMELGDLDGARADFETVRGRTRESNRVKDLIRKVADLQEKEKNIDYYELLEVKRSASEQELKDAYRKAVIKWHPDRHRDAMKKKEAEKKMKMINKAYDVLSDQKKRALYDNGQDPDKPMGGGGGGFPGGGVPGGGFPGGGGQTFTFHMGGGGGGFNFGGFNFGGFGMGGKQQQKRGGQQQRRRF